MNKSTHVICKIRKLMNGTSTQAYLRKCHILGGKSIWENFGENPGKKLGGKSGENLSSLCSLFLFFSL